MHALIVTLALVLSVAGNPQRGLLPPSNNAAAPRAITGQPSINATAPIVPISGGRNVSAPVNNVTAPPAAATAPVLAGGCAKVCQRKEIRQLTKEERDAFIRALQRMQSGPSPTQYDTFVKRHVDAKKFAHGNAYFLPWHRAYLVDFEKALQAIDPSICLPYWNWSLDSQAPELSVIFNADFFGGNGGQDGRSGGCVTTGPFANWRPAYPQPHCLERRFDGKDKISAFHSIESVNRVVSSNKDYDSFRRSLETGLHPGVHLNIGGDIAAMHSPNDPIFFLHHNYIEFLWVSHQKMHGITPFTGAGLDGASASTSQALLGMNYNVAQVMDSSKLCYEYVELEDKDLGDVSLPPSKVKPPTGGQHPPSVSVGEIPSTPDRFDPLDRTNIGMIRVPPKVDEAWLVMNNQDVNYTREFEKEYQNVYSELNNIKGYKSPCSLWRRPSMFAKLVERAPTADLCVDVPDVGRVKVSGAELNKEEGAVDPLQVVSDVKVVCVVVAPNVELPPDAYSDQLQNVVGSQAFSGAGNILKKLIPGSSAAPALNSPTASHSLMALSAAMAVIVFQALM